MSFERKPIGHELSQLVEKQLRNWEIGLSQDRRPPEDAEHPVAAFVVLSRAVGLPAYQVATLLHERLDWPLFDKQILQAMAGDDDYRRRLYNNMDGRDLGWLEGFVRGLLQDKYGKDDYFRRLTSTVLSLARQGHAIFVGRGTQLILPEGVGFRVRLTATPAFCLDSYARQKQLTTEEAAREVKEIEEDRATYMWNHFKAKPGDPTKFDLSINMEGFSVEDTTELILSAMRIRGMVGGEDWK